MNDVNFTVMDNKSLISPPDWDKKLWELDPTNPENNGLQNEDLIVWMRTAAFPNFRKLYRKIDMTGPYEDKLPKGKYRYQIDYSKYFFFCLVVFYNQNLWLLAFDSVNQQNLWPFCSMTGNYSMFFDILLGCCLYVQGVDCRNLNATSLNF